MNKTIIKVALATILSLTFSLSANAGLIINEIFQNPSAVADAEGEWFELFNDGLVDIDINGWTIKDDDNDEYIIDNGSSLYVYAGGFLVLGVNDDASTNGGILVDYQYDYNDIKLANGTDELVLLDINSIEIDRVEWDSGTTFPDPAGATMAFTSTLADNNVGENWKESTATISGTNADHATPGACNTDVGQICTVDVPEPNSIAILGLGLLGLAFSRKKSF